MAEKAAAKPVMENQSFVDVLMSMMGKVVTVVNPESYESAPVGHQLREGFYPAKVVGVGRDYLVVVTEYVKKGKDARKEPVKQYIPVEKIKRLSLMKNERLIHL
ncbi:MAG: hypothetical protein ACYTGV_14525 [Planctomycetota bacterium]|jgi:hypothetical protein